MKKQFTLLFLAISLAVKVDASLSKSDEISTTDLSGNYVHFYMNSLKSYFEEYGIGSGIYMQYLYSDTTYVSMSIENDSITENGYIINGFCQGNVSAVSASFNPETGVLEIPRQAIREGQDLVNMRDNNASIKATIQSNRLVFNDDWGVMITEGESAGDYTAYGKEAFIVKANATMEYINYVDIYSFEKKIHVRVEQEPGSQDLYVLNFGNTSKSIVVNLLSDSRFYIPPQLVYIMNQMMYDTSISENGWYIDWSHQFYLQNSDGDRLGIPGTWTSSTMNSDGEWFIGQKGGWNWGNYTPFLLTMYSGSIVSPFATNAPGDVNDDGKVNVSDVTALINMIMGITSMDEAGADVNGDGKVNVSDVSALINIILGIQ